MPVAPMANPVSKVIKMADLCDGSSAFETTGTFDARPWKWRPGGVGRRLGLRPADGRWLEWPCGQTGAALGRLWGVGGVTARGRGFAVDLVLADRGLNGSECGWLSELPTL